MRGFSTSPPILPLYASPSANLHLPSSDFSSSPYAFTRNLDATLLALNRQIAYLRQTLQNLLDAQSTGLLAGLGRNEDDTTSLASRSSISGSNGTERPMSTSRSQPRAPQKSALRNISLHSARTGITTTLQELSTLSEHKSSRFASYLSSQVSLLKSLDSITEKHRGIATAIESINNDPDSGNPRITTLIAEEYALDQEILESEEKLRLLKVKRLAVKQEREQRENRLGAKLSSWKAAADDLERDVRDRILRSPPPDFGGTGDSKGGVWALPRDRRTVELVKEETEDERKGLQKQIEEVEKEREACANGAEVWTSVVQTVENVESGLREEMGRLGVASPQNRQEGGMRRVIALLDDAIAQVEAKVELAERKDWSLMICCIGAELEALKEGREMLDGALDLSEADLLDDNGVFVSGSSYKAAKDEHLGISTRNVNSTGLAFSVAGDARERANYVERSEEENDEPGPELLISHQEAF